MPNVNEDYYLYSGNEFWTSSPDMSKQFDGLASVWIVLAGDVVDSGYSLASDSGARPVINLRAYVEFTGNGSFETPYIIKTN